MHVFRIRSVEPRRFRQRALFNLVERRDDLLRFSAAQDTYFLQAARPRTIKLQFKQQQSPVEVERAFEFVERLIRSALETPAPHLFLSCLAHFAAFPLPTGTVIGSANRLMNPSASFGL